MDDTRNDIQLWNKLRRSNRDAFSKLYERYVDVLYNYACKICKDKELIEDAIQDLFIDLWKYRKHLSQTTSVRYYLYYALRTRVVRALSKSGNWSFKDGLSWDEVEGLMTSSAEHQQVELEALDEKTKKLRKYLHNLSPRQYEAIVLRFYDDFSYEEIASLMQANPQSIRNLVQRGLSQLKQYGQLLMCFLAAVLELA